MRVFLLVIAFASGAAVAWVAKDSRRAAAPPAPGAVNIDFAQPIRFTRATYPGEPDIKLVPYKQVTRGQPTVLGPPPLGEGEVWRIEINDAETIIFATVK